MSLKRSRRITKKTLLAAGSGTFILGAFLFTYLFTQGLITVDDYTANTWCGGDTVCWLELNNTCFKQDVFIYPMNGSEIINAQPSDTINSFKLYRRWSTWWEEIKLNETCKSTRCGGKVGVTENKYAWVGRKGKCYDLRIEVNKDWNSTIEWSINPSGVWEGYELLYKTHNESINILNYTDVIVPDIYIEKNDTLFKGYNYTVKEIIGYEEIIIKDRVIGVKLLNNSIYPANINNDEICIWNVPIGDRDFINYPCCTELELNNSACMIIKLSELEEGILK